MDKKITRKQLKSAAYQLGCEPAVLDAVFQVESSGSGFDNKKRPKILFEKHIFYRYLPKSKRRAALKAGLATKHWIGRYDDQRGYDARWRLFHAALELDKEAAIMATSFGIGQIMGFNYKMSGFVNVTDFAKAMHKDEFNQLMAVAWFVHKQPTLQQAFKHADFQVIARYYNGSGQVGVYAAKMQRAYQNSPYSQYKTASGITRTRNKALRLGSSGARVKTLQNTLVLLGYATDVDGDFGRFTEDAVILFQRHNGLKMDGVVGERTLAALKQAQPLEPNRKPLPEVIKTSKPVQASLATTAFGAVAGLSSLAGDIATPTAVSSSDFLQNLKTIGETAKMTEQAVRPIGSLANYVQSHAVISVAAVAVALGLWAFSRSIKAFRNRNWSFS